MATLQEEENLRLAAQDELNNIIRDKVRTLVEEGRPDLAAQILIEHARINLPDGHPSRNPGKNGQLVGEQVSQLSRFESDATKTKDALAFAHALWGGTIAADIPNAPIPEQLENLLGVINAMHLTIATIAKEIVEKHSGLMPSLTRVILGAKREAGFMAALPEGEAKLVEGKEEDYETADEE